MRLALFVLLAMLGCASTGATKTWEQPGLGGAVRPEMGSPQPGDAARFVAMRHSVPDVAIMRRFVADAARNKIGFLYITDGAQPNPWNRLPRWWDEELNAVAEANPPTGQ